jgi:quinolinate synthase
LVEQIAALRAERGAVILAHNYQPAEVQDIADFVGDSLELSRRAAATDAEVIVFCGVTFMAETAAILSPQKTVLLPNLEAGCPMAAMITAEQLRARKAELPGVPVVCYVNSTAEVKAESDICCTSANAIKVVESLPDDRVLFVPDSCLGQWVARHTKKEVILWPGYCVTHHRIFAEDILRLKRLYPDAEAFVHPECTNEVVQVADQVLSTGGMIRRAGETSAHHIIIATECGIIHRLQKENPDKEFHCASELALCPNMKRITLEHVLDSLREMKYRIQVEESIRVRALRTIERMLAVQ